MNNAFSLWWTGLSKFVEYFVPNWRRWRSSGSIGATTGDRSPNFYVGGQQCIGPPPPNFLIVIFKRQEISQQVLLLQPTNKHSCHQNAGFSIWFFTNCLGVIPWPSRWEGTTPSHTEPSLCWFEIFSFIFLTETTFAPVSLPSGFHWIRTCHISLDNECWKRCTRYSDTRYSNNGTL